MGLLTKTDRTHTGKRRYGRAIRTMRRATTALSLIEATTAFMRRQPLMRGQLGRSWTQYDGMVMAEFQRLLPFADRGKGCPPNRLLGELPNAD